MKIVAWTATVLSLIGIILNSYMLIWCWPVWMLANLLWMFWSTKKKEWSQLILWIVFFVTNIYGWYQWSLLT
jgi:nicotinamide mononucleotide transporter